MEVVNISWRVTNTSMLNKNTKQIICLVPQLCNCSIRVVIQLYLQNFVYELVEMFILYTKFIFYIIIFCYKCFFCKPYFCAFQVGTSDLTSCADSLIGLTVGVLMF